MDPRLIANNPPPHRPVSNVNWGGAQRTQETFRKLPLTLTPADQWPTLTELYRLRADNKTEIYWTHAAAWFALGLFCGATLLFLLSCLN